MASRLTPTFDNKIKGEITLISFCLGNRTMYMLLKDKDEVILDKIYEFQKMGLEVTIIYLHDSTERLLSEKENIVLSENQFVEPDSSEKFMKMIMDLDPKPIPTNPWPDKSPRHKLRLGPKNIVSRLVSALVEKPEKQLSARRINYSKYPREILTLAEVLPFCPKTNYIIFVALGSYQQTYHFSAILETFQTFVQDYQEQHCKTMVLVLGGEYDHKRDYPQYRDIQRSYQQLPNSIVYLKQQMSVAEKKAILRSATVEFDYKVGIQNAFNVRLGFQAAVPFLSAPESYSWQFMADRNFGYCVHDIYDYQSSATLMHHIILNIQIMSARVRQYNNSYMSNMHRVLQEFEEEDPKN